MILFLKSIFKERIWGSHYFKEQLGYPLDDNLYGEMWSVSAHPEGDCQIDGGPFNGMTLSEVYESHQTLFGTKDPEFPLMVKLIHTNADLSVQVHPDDEYARAVEHQNGKTECWYFVNNPQNPIVLGHNAKTKEEIRQAIKEGTLEKLLKKTVVKKDDFVLINAKTIHALTSGLLVVEIQQSSDVTYRLYDYHRKDKNGNYRPLHIDKALDVIEVPDQTNHEVKNFSEINGLTNLVDGDKFCCNILDIIESANIFLSNNTFTMLTVISGTIILDNHQLQMGESAIILNDESNIKVIGNGRIVLSTPKAK